MNDSTYVKGSSTFPIWQFPRANEIQISSFSTLYYCTYARCVGLQESKMKGAMTLINLCTARGHSTTNNKIESTVDAMHAVIRGIISSSDHNVLCTSISRCIPYCGHNHNETGKCLWDERGDFFCNLLISQTFSQIKCTHEKFSIYSKNEIFFFCFGNWQDVFRTEIKFLVRTTVGDPVTIRKFNTVPAER